MMAADNPIRVDIEALAGSAAQVAGQGEDLATAHACTDDRIVAAQSGWVGSSALALQSRAAVWLETSRRLLSILGDHAQTLNNDGLCYTALESQNLERLRTVGDEPGGPA